MTANCCDLAAQFGIEPEVTPHDTCRNLGLELTRPARAIKLWLTLRVLGTETVGRMIDTGFYNAEAAQKRLQELPDWEIVSAAQMAIIVFRYAPVGLDAKALDQINGMISKEAIETNTACILTT